MAGETLVKVENVSKRFCRSLKRSMLYGLRDMGSELIGRRHGGGTGLPRSSAEVRLRRQEFWALQDVSFEVKRGECLALIGRNGAGKTTLLRMLNGLLKPDTGRIEMRGHVGALIALGAGFNALLTGRENIRVNASLHGLSQREIEEKTEEIIEFAEIGDFIDAPIRTYSSGMKVRLGFATASTLNPDILIIDEVLAVGDNGFKIKCLNRIQEILARSAVLFVSHSMPMVARTSTQALTMQPGRAPTLCTIEEGIDWYYSLFDKTEAREFGIGDAKLSVIRLLTEGGVEITGPVDPEKPFLIKIAFDCHFNRREVSLGLTITSSDQRNVMTVLDRDKQYISFVVGQGNTDIYIRIDSLRLMGGNYSLNVQLSSGFPPTVHTRVDAATSFSVSHVLATACDCYTSARLIENNLGKPGEADSRYSIDATVN